MADQDAESLQHSPKRLRASSRSSSGEAVGELPALWPETIQDESSGDISRPQTATVDDDTPPADPQDERTSDADDDSTFEEDAQSTTSLPNEVEGRIINGREYNSIFPDVLPWTPTDEHHCNAMDMRHCATTKLFNGALYQAPLKKNIQCVLDVGTGTGLWAIDFAEKYPNADVIGTDISHIQPHWVPNNVRFQIHDCTGKWTWNEEHFDYINMRQLTGSIADWESLFRKTSKYLKPDGFLESHEQSLCFWHSGQIPFDPALEGPTGAVATWNAIFREAGRQSGQSFTVADGNTQRDSMEAAGFTSVKEYRKQIPIGGWAKDDNLKESGKYLQAALLDDLGGLLNYPATELGWSLEEITVFLAEVRKALRSKQLHLYIKVVVVVGQKPG